VVAPGGVRTNTQQGGSPVTLIYLVAAIVAAGLFVYLVIALLKPEWFQ
jgi:K+-transporting ATPase KdpF subunit